MSLELPYQIPPDQLVPDPTCTVSLSRTSEQQNIPGDLGPCSRDGVKALEGLRGKYQSCEGAIHSNPAHQATAALALETPLGATPRTLGTAPYPRRRQSSNLSHVPINPPKNASLPPFRATCKVCSTSRFAGQSVFVDVIGSVRFGGG